MTTATDRSPSRLAFTRLLANEARGAVRRPHLVMLVLLSVVGVLVALWLPGWPDLVRQFFDRVLNLPTWSEVVLGNNYVAIIFFLYWFGVFDLLRVYVLPLEESYLDLVLSKPVTRSSYMFARILPSYVVLLSIGVIAAAIHAVAMIALGLPIDAAAYAGTVVAILGLTLAMLSLANLLMLFVRDSFAAVLIGFVVFMAVFIPSIVYLYRPDVYLTSPIPADIAVFPLTLQWHPAFAAAWGHAIGLVFAAVAAALVVVAGTILKARDVT